MGKSSTPAPTPDPMIGQAAQGNVELGRESLEFARQQYADGKIRQADLDALTKQVADSALDSQNKSNAWAQEDRDVSAAARTKYDGWADEDRATQAGLRDKYDNWATQDRQLGRDTAAYADGLAGIAQKNGEMYEQIYGKEAQRQSTFGMEEMDRYKSTFRPIQDKMASDAMSWDSADRMESEAGKARADVMSSADMQRQAGQRQMASMGVNPNSGRFAGVERATDTMTALGAAGAQNAARDNVRSQGIALRGQAAQVGQQVVGNGQQANQISLSAVGAGQNARQSGLSMAMQAKNLGLAASGVGNTSAGLSVGQTGAGNGAAGLSLGNQGAGYSGLASAGQFGNAAIGATQAGTNGWMQNNAGMQAGFGSGMAGNSSGAGIASGLYGQQLNGWNAQQQANGQTMSGIGSLVGTGAALFL